MEQDDQSGDAPCFAHTLIDGQPVDAGTAKDVARFRKAERERLYAERRNLPSGRRAELTARICRDLDRVLGEISGQRVAVYWPIRGEPDLRNWMTKAHERGAATALPVVIERAAPLEFHEWSPRCKMTRGDWNIPIPADRMPLSPDIVISPLVGVDEAGYRLGNGGGYYDRTLATLNPKPIVIGVGFGFCRMKTIYPMPWDIAMDRVVLSD
jgi:5,10-methenyltetrahydrofolate synthetase